MNRKWSFRELLFLLLLLTFSGKTFASYPIVPTNYSSTYIYTYTNCVGPDASTFEGANDYVYWDNTVSQNSDLLTVTQTVSASTGLSPEWSYSPGFSISYTETIDQNGVVILADGFPPGYDAYWTTSGGYYENNIGFSTVNATTSCDVFVRETPDSSAVLINPENAPSTSITNNTAVLQSQITALATNLNVRINHALKGYAGGFSVAGKGGMYEFVTGKAAGEGLSNIGMWGSYSLMDFESENAAFLYDGNRHNFMVGADFSPKDKMIVGLSLGFETTDIDTTFNRGALDSDGYTVVPYFGALLDNGLTVDGMIGYSTIESDQYRYLPGAALTRANRITSSPDAERWFAAVNMNYEQQFNNLLLGAKGGLLWAKEEQDGFTESNGQVNAGSETELSQIQVGGEVAFIMNEQFLPFAKLTYNYDLDSSNNNISVGTTTQSIVEDNDDYMAGLGFRYMPKENITAGFEWNHRFGRDDFEEDSFTLDVRAQF